MGVESPIKKNSIFEIANGENVPVVAEQPLKMSMKSVKRSLFGKVDHDEVMSFFQLELSQLYADKMKKWNFDFVNEKPINGGHFDWQKVAVPNESCRQPMSPVKSNDKVTKTNIACKSTFITSHWSKCKKINRRNTFAKNVTSSKKQIHKSMERIK